MNIKVKSLMPTGEVDFAVKEEIGSAQKNRKWLKTCKTEIERMKNTFWLKQ